MPDINVLLAIRNQCKLARQRADKGDRYGSEKKDIALAENIEAIIEPWLSELDLAVEHKNRQDAMIEKAMGQWADLIHKTRGKVKVQEFDANKSPEAVGAATTAACPVETGGEETEAPAVQEAAAGDIIPSHDQF